MANVFQLQMVGAVRTAQDPQQQQPPSRRRQHQQAQNNETERPEVSIRESPTAKKKRPDWKIEPLPKGWVRLAIDQLTCCCCLAADSTISRCGDGRLTCQSINYRSTAKRYSITLSAWSWAEWWWRDSSRSFAWGDCHQLRLWRKTPPSLVRIAC